MCGKCEWIKVLQVTRVLRENPKARFAYDFITSTMRWIEANSHVTQRQHGALAKIERKVGPRKRVEEYSSVKITPVADVKE